MILFDFREKITRYNAENKVKVPDETVTDVVNKKNSIKDNSPIWRQYHLTPVVTPLYYLGGN
ncbi:MAG: hypothetical protein CEE43_12890 [Promethearchaeota archaeon Loki_b32]|nr:MAG: hypothetical protein CEE43_12890 [Candidatus Lokiarchaeota archaeon Loki_b32]